MRGQGGAPLLLSDEGIACHLIMRKELCKVFMLYHSVMALYQVYHWLPETKMQILHTCGISLSNKTWHYIATPIEKKNWQIVNWQKLYPGATGVFCGCFMGKDSEIIAQKSKYQCITLFHVISNVRKNTVVSTLLVIFPNPLYHGDNLTPNR